VNDEQEVARLRAWLQFYADFYRYALPGVAECSRAALRGDAPPEWKLSEKTDKSQGEHALQGVDGVLADLFGSYWKRQIERADVAKAIRKHLGI